MIKVKHSKKALFYFEILSALSSTARQQLKPLPLSIKIHGGLIPEYARRFILDGPYHNLLTE